jgi:hypothetical protein
VRLPQLYLPQLLQQPQQPLHVLPPLLPLVLPRQHLVLHVPPLPPLQHPLLLLYLPLVGLQLLDLNNQEDQVDMQQVPDKLRPLLVDY